MKKYYSILTLSAALGATGYAAPFLAVGDNAELFITGQAGVRADSNIYLTPIAKKDTIFTVAPGVEFDFGKNSNTQGLFRFAENFTAYSDHSDLNSNLASTAFNAGYDDGKSKASFNVNYDELNQNSIDTATRGDFLIRSNVFDIGGSGEVSVTQKSSVAGAVDYRWTDYRTVGFTDAEVLSLPIHYYYEVTPKVDLGFGYRYRASWLQFGQDAFDNFYSVSARGEFTPKLTGKIDIGVTQRRFSNANDISLLGIDAGLNYAVTPKTSLAFNVSNDFDTNSQAQQQKNLVIGLQASSTISDVWSVSLGLSYRSIDYYRLSTDSRTDEFYSGQAGLTYTLNTNVSITGAVSYGEYHSPGHPQNEFSGSVFSLAANLRF